MLHPVGFLVYCVELTNEIQGYIMSYTAKVFNVMIASPSDVSNERSIARNVIHEWNAIHSNKTKVVLLPIGWESHSSPEMGDEPQHIINSQILSKCDLLIGVFWTRVGTSTGDYISGTVEEIETHIQEKKPAMLYFSTQPVAMATVDLKQIEALNAFKESCRNRSLYELYDNPSDFKEKFYRHLQIKVNEHDLFSGIEGTTSSEILELPIPIPTLNEKSRILLKEASNDEHGIILHMRFIGGEEIQTNGRSLIESGNRREVAAWESALQELVDKGLAVDRSGKQEYFEITDAGYRMADMIGDL